MDDYANIDIDIVERGGVVIVAVEGEVDLCAAALFERSLAFAAATDAPAIVLDLDRVSFMDSAAVHVLLRFSISEGDRDRLSLTHISPQVQRLLAVTGVRCYPSYLPSLERMLSGSPPTTRRHLSGR